MSPRDLLNWAMPPEEPSAARTGAHRSLRQVLMPLFRLASENTSCWRAESVGFWRAGNQRYWIPRLVFTSQGEGGAPFKLGIFAGIHGDEPAGVEALSSFVSLLNLSPGLARDYELHVYPVCNPTGFEDGTRHSRSGLDLNREFWKDSREPEVRILEERLREEKYHGLIALHSDYESDGLYGFARGALITRSLLEPALAAAAGALPLNLDSSIDGFHAVNGIIHSAYDGILSAPPGAKPEPFEIILETPTHAPILLQSAALVFALTAILRVYREFMAYGAGL